MTPIRTRLFVTTALGLSAAALPAHAQTAPGANSVATPPPSQAVQPLTAGDTNSPAAADAAPASPAATAAAGEIVVTGVRASLETAISIKRNAPQIVDSIVAEDIGKLPDNTVSDALQRVTGVQVTRGGGETTGVDIRGLPNAATLLNGREVFTGTGRGVALQDIPAELIAGVDVYKTSTPDIIEGGVAGVIDIRLHRPFDFDGFTAAAGGRGVYSDQAKKWGYLADGLVSDRWTTGIGDVGVLLGASYNRRKYEDQTAFDFVYSGAPVATPDTVGGIYQDGDRQRTAFNGSLQWRPSPNLEFYADGIYTRYNETYGVNFFIGLPKAGNVTSVTARSDAPSLAQSATTLNDYTLTSKQAYHNITDTYQADIGGKWHSGRARITSEFVYNYSRLPDRNAIVDTSFNAPSVAYNFDQNGTPHVDITGVDITNLANFYIRTLFDNHSLATSKQYAWRGDVAYDVDAGPIKTFKMGVRYTDRQADSQATASVPIPNPNPNGTQLTSIPGMASISPSNLVNGKLGVSQFALSDTNFLLNNTDTIRTLFGQPTGARPYNATLAFFDNEKTYAVYEEAEYAFDIGSVRVDGVGGVRIVNTVENLSGDGINARENYVDALPSLTARVRFTDKFQAHLAFGKTITRPDFAALNPLVTYVPSGQTGTQQYAGTGAGGNPGLQPIKSTAYDVSLEYYMSHSASATLGGFYHKINGYIQTYSQPEQYGTNAAGVPTYYLVSRPRNTGDGKLYGAEAAYQQFFDFLPGLWSGLGVQLNGTYLQGTTQDPLTGAQERLTNVSKWSYNLVGIYEKGGVSLRLAYNWRSSYIDSYNSGGTQGSTIEVSPISQLDFSGSYSPLQWLTLTFDATNLLDRTYHDRFVGANSVTGMVSSVPRDTRMYDRTFEFGARVKF